MILVYTMYVSPESTLMFNWMGKKEGKHENTEFRILK